jgi:uncharacterized protein YjbI with pentapeptide repeats
VADNFDGRDLSGQKVPRGTGLSFARATLVGAELSGDYPSCVFDGADLSEAHGVGANLRGASFRGARLQRARMFHALCTGADFSGADLSNASLERSELESARLVGASLGNADLFCAALSQADLTNADLSGAFLVGTRFAGAKLSGAKLSGCDFFGADTEGADFAKAESAAVTPFAGMPGPAVTKFNAIATKAPKLVVTFRVKGATGTAELKLHFENAAGRYYPCGWAFVEARSGARRDGLLQAAPDSSTAPTHHLLTMARLFHAGRVDFESLTVKSSKSRVKGNALKELVIGAIAEAFATEPAAAAGSPSAAGFDPKQEALRPLREGRIDDWNRDRLYLALGDDAPSAPAALAALRAPHDFRRVALSKLDLSGADLSELTLAGADLRGARLRGARLSAANMTEAALEEADLGGAVAVGATFERARLRGASLAGADLRYANLSGADLTGADLAGANLLGARGAEARAEPATDGKAAAGSRGSTRVVFDRSLDSGGSTGTVSSVSFAPAGRTLLAVVAAHGKPAHLDVVDFENVDAPSERQVEGFRAQRIHFDEDGAAIGLGREIVRLDVARRHVKQLPPEGVLSPTGFRLVDRARLAFLASSMSVASADLGTARRRDVYMDYNVSIISADLSPNGRYVALNSGRYVFVRSFATGKQVKRLEITGSQAHAVCFSPDSSLLACGTNRGTIDVFVTGTFERCATLKHPATIHVLAFSRSGRRLASASWDISPRDVARGVRVWDTATMSLEAEVDWDRAMADGLSFSADESLLAVAEWDRCRYLVVELGAHRY